jgi:hypothetical protein
MSSLTVAPPVVLSLAEQLTAAPTEAQRDEEDDAFVYDWIKSKVTEGEFPSINSLQGQAAKMKEHRSGMTHARIRSAVDRLKAKSLVVTAPTKSPSGNTWLRAVDQPSTPAGV